MKKEVKVVMQTSEKAKTFSMDILKCIKPYKDHLFDGEFDEGKIGDIIVSSSFQANEKYWEVQHIYICDTSENVVEFVEGQWYYTEQSVLSNGKNRRVYHTENYNEIIQYINGTFKASGDFDRITVFNIIATTNLEIDSPRIPMNFINEFCRNGGVNEVLVEYENDYESSSNEYFGGEIPFIPKLKISQDYEISISLKPIVFSTEIMEMLEKAHWFGWVARERLESPDKFPYDKRPHGLDYEESEDFCFQQFLEKHNIKQ